LVRFSPIDDCIVPGVLPLDAAVEHCPVRGYGSRGSAWIDRWFESRPFASASICWPAVSCTVVAPLTVTVPSNTLIRFVALARTST